MNDGVNILGSVELGKPSNGQDGGAVRLFDAANGVWVEIYANDGLRIPGTIEVGGGVNMAGVLFVGNGFAVQPSGELWTSKAWLSTATGVKVARLPIYDMSGNLIGYIPIMDA